VRFEEVPFLRTDDYEKSFSQLRKPFPPDPNRPFNEKVHRESGRRMRDAKQ
jgi:hypothetical protein